MKDNVEIDARFDLTFSQTMFFSEFARELELDRNLHNVEWYKEAGGIHLKGRACLVRKGKQYWQTVQLEVG